MRLRRATVPRAFAAAASACLIVAGCGGGDAATTATETMPAKPAAAATAPLRIEMGEFFYRPRAATVRVGQAVRFVNVGEIEHTVADTDAKGAVRSRLIKPKLLASGASQTVRFTKAGLVRYLCTLHPTLMKGTVRVTG